MPGPNKVNILISVQDRASRPIKKVRKQVRDFRDDLVRFNRRMFTASAILATFAMGFRKAFQLARVGADFDMFRQQFYKTFGEDFFKTLRSASKGTMDAMSIMQLAVQNHARGLSKLQQQQIFTFSVPAAKLMGKKTSEAAKMMSKALHTMSVTGMQTFFMALNTNNQFKNMEVFIKRLTKGLNAAGKSAENFRRVALSEMSRLFSTMFAQTDDAKTMFMVLGAGFNSLKQVVGTFVARALAPLAGKLGLLVWDLFDKLNNVLSNTSDNIKTLRRNLVNLVQMGGGVLAVGAGLLGGFSLLALAASTLGVTMGSLVGLMMLMAGALVKVKDSSKGWMDALANIGAELKFYFQAFASYRDGVSTFSGEVVDKIRGMERASQNRILRIAKYFALLREAWNGFMDGFRGSIGFIGKVFSKIAGMFGLTPKQFSASSGAIAGNIGKILGILTVVAGLKALFGGLLSKIPIIGKLFGGRRPRGSFTDPMWVRMAGAGGLMGRGIGRGVMGGIGMIRGAIPLLTQGVATAFVASAGTVVAAVLASAAFGALIGYLIRKFFNTDELISNWMLGRGAKSDAEVQKDYVNSVTGMRAHTALSGALNDPKIKWEESQYQKQIQESMAGFMDAEGRTKHGGVDLTILTKALLDGNVTRDEQKDILDSIKRMYREEGKLPPSGKPNGTDQLYMTKQWR